MESPVAFTLACNDTPVIRSTYCRGITTSVAVYSYSYIAKYIRAYMHMYIRSKCILTIIIY